MSDNKKLDGFFQSSFSDYSPDVPPHIWENIAAEKRKKRPVAFWQNKKNMLVLAVLLLTVSGAGILFTQNSQQQDISLEADSNGRQQGAENTTPPAVVNNEPAKGNNSNAATAVGDKKVDATASAVNPAVIADQNGPTTTANPAQKSKEGKIKSGLSTADESVDLAALPRSNTASKGRLFSKRSTTRTSQTNPEATDIDNDQDLEDAAIAIEPTDQGITIPVLDGSREKIPVAVLANKTNIHPVIKAMNIPCPEAEKNAAGNKTYFEVYAGPDFAFKQYSDTGNSELVQKRKESLSVQSAYSAGFRFTKVFANGMSIRSGVNYSQINEKFTYLKDNLVQLVYVINPQGDTTDRYYVRGTRYNTSYNRYRTIDIPLIMGYELGNSRLHANINAGVMLNVYSWQKGETLDDNYLPVSISTGKEGNAAYQYKTNLGVGFIGAASVYYKLNDRLHLLAEPYFRFNLSPMNKEASSIQEKFTTMGLRFGLRVDF